MCMSTFMKVSSSGQGLALILWIRKHEAHYKTSSPCMYVQKTAMQEWVCDDAFPATPCPPKKISQTMLCGFCGRMLHFLTYNTHGFSINQLVEIGGCIYTRKYSNSSLRCCQGEKEKVTLYMLHCRQNSEHAGLLSCWLGTLSFPWQHLMLQSCFLKQSWALGVGAQAPNVSAVQTLSWLHKSWWLVSGPQLTGQVLLAAHPALLEKRDWAFWLIQQLRG